MQKCATIRIVAHNVITLGLLANFAVPTAWSSPSPQQAERITVPHTATAVLDRFEISPGDVTLTASQAQRFQVTNTKGEVIPVHWTVSSPNCSGSVCGTIDDNGDYVAPSSLPKSLVLVLEGVLVSDPKHSVLTRIQLVPNVDSVTPAPAGTSTGQRQRSSAPAAAENSAGPSAELPALQDTDFAAPVRTGVDRKLGSLVAYQDGLLTIDVENTSLAAVLKLVAQKTGAVIDLPPGSGLEPIVAHAGPGRANDVLTQLLNGSHYNFIVISSPQHPYEPERVVLSMRTEDTEVAKTVSAPAAAPAPPVSKTPPDSAASVPMVTPQLDSILTPPKEQLPPEALGELMKEKARELREKFQQEAPQR